MDGFSRGSGAETLGHKVLQMCHVLELVRTSHMESSVVRVHMDFRQVMLHQSEFMNDSKENTSTH